MCLAISNFLLTKVCIVKLRSCLGLETLVLPVVMY